MGDWYTLPIRLSAELNGAHYDIFFGVDLHKTQFTVHVRTEEESESLDQIKLYKTDESGYKEFLNRIRLYKETGFEVKIGVESTGNTGYFKNQVEKAGAKVTVINMFW